MSDDRQTSRRVMETARALAGMAIEPSDARAAVQRVRLSLTARPRRHGVWIISSGLAAAIVLIVAMIIIDAPSQARAAAALQAAATKSSAFRGWLHITVTPVGPATSKPAINASQIHTHTVTHAMAMVFEVAGQRAVMFSDPQKHQQLFYSALTNTMQVMPLEDRTSSTGPTLRRKEVVYRLGAMLQQLRESDGKSRKVIEFTDDGLTRYDISGAEITSDGKLSVWCDPQTKMIRRIRQNVDGAAVDLNYTYGEPEIRDIYDLGVPRNVAVVDLHDPSATSATTRPRVFDEPDLSGLTKDEPIDFNELAARIQKRQQAEFGDYVMIECSELKSLQGSNRQGSLQIEARHGQRAARANYLLAPAMIFLGGPGFPPGWPTPKLADALATIKSTRPIALSVYDGKTLWTLNGPDAALEGKATFPMLAMMNYQLGRRLWAIQGFGPAFGEQKVELLRDASRPGLIVLHVEQTLAFWPNRANEPRKVDVMYWIDPKRDDLPLEWIQKSNDDGGDKLNFEIHQVVPEFAQLADGRWYPTHWQLNTSRPPQEGVTDLGGYQDVHCQIVQDATLPKEWFEDPSDRLQRARPLFPATGPINNASSR